MPVGKFLGRKNLFTLKKDKVEKADRIFLFTDGYSDQFGGEHNKKYSRKRFKELLIKSGQFTFDKARDYIQMDFDNWIGTNEQIDDVLVVGIEIV